MGVFLKEVKVTAYGDAMILQGKSGVCDHGKSLWEELRNQLWENQCWENKGGEERKNDIRRGKVNLVPMKYFS